MLATEVKGLVCRFCGERMPPHIALGKHEQYCIKNPRASTKPVIDLRTIGHDRPRPEGANPSLRVVTCNFASIMVDAVDELVRRGVAPSRSEYMRVALHNQLLVDAKLIDRLGAKD